MLLNFDRFFVALPGPIIASEIAAGFRADDDIISCERGRDSRNRNVDDCGPSRYLTK
jgi:hypothetical protein